MPIKHHMQTSKADNSAYDASKDEWNEPHDVTSGSATIVAGSTYVDVIHGVGSTPDINKINWHPQGDLHGYGTWISNVGATTFRINIGSQLMEDITFGWNIL